MTHDGPNLNVCGYMNVNVFISYPFMYLLRHSKHSVRHFGIWKGVLITEKMEDWFRMYRGL